MIKNYLFNGSLISEKILLKNSHNECFGKLATLRKTARVLPICMSNIMFYFKVDFLL